MGRVAFADPAFPATPLLVCNSILPDTHLAATNGAIELITVYDGEDWQSESALAIVNPGSGYIRAHFIVAHTGPSPWTAKLQLLELQANIDPTTVTWNSLPSLGDTLAEYSFGNTTGGSEQQWQVQHSATKDLLLRVEPLSGFYDDEPWDSTFSVDSLSAGPTIVI